MKVLKLAAVGAALFAASAASHAGATFDNVKKKGFVQCGVSTGIPGFSIADSKGEWKGLDVDLCRAIAATMFGDASKIKVTPLNTQQRFTALQSGEVDVLTRNTTVTLTRDTTLGLIGVGVNYDSQGVMVSGPERQERQGTERRHHLRAARHHHRAEPGRLVPRPEDRIQARRDRQVRRIIRAFSAGRCDAFTTDKSQLASTRTTLENPDKYVILPEGFSKEPLGPMVRQGDEQWFNVVRWSLNAMLEAEEYGITKANVDEMTKSTNPNIQRILGVTPGMGKNLGVDDKWAYNIIKQVGNYGESFETTLGQKSAMKLERGLNASYKNGGLMYGWPVR